MDVKIGIADSGRELSVSVDEDKQQLTERVTAALAEDSLLLTDDKGRTLIVPSARIAYVEIGPVDGRRVGFSVGS